MRLHIIRDADGWPVEIQYGGGAMPHVIFGDGVHEVAIGEQGVVITEAHEGVTKTIRLSRGEWREIMLGSERHEKMEEEEEKS